MEYSERFVGYITSSGLCCNIPIYANPKWMESDVKNWPETKEDEWSEENEAMDAYLNSLNVVKGGQKP